VRRLIANERLSEVKRFLRAAEEGRAARRALTHSLLAVSRWQTLDPQTTDVNPFVAGMAAPVKPFAMASLAAKISDILQT
jgi:hypothetical protein